MNMHIAKWPSTQISDVLLSKRNGAWFVSFSDEQGFRQLVRKANGKPKGYRRAERIILLLRNRNGIDKFNVEAR